MRIFKTILATALAGVLATAALAGELKKNIVDTAVEAGQFETLVAAAKAAGIAEALKGEGPFTVFAPTDAAFEALPEGAVESLLQPENKGKLAAILAYHVIPGKVMSTDIAGQELRQATMQGEMVDINAKEGLTIQNANIVKTDIAASNGVIHVIDKVILPEAAM
jgi:uncharacterized surface protein with fasciclin (FAS1) repeats